MANKKNFFPLLMMTALSVFACSRGTDLQFCEGISTEGEGVNCGTEFESGELTAVIKSEKPFGQERVDIEVYEIGQNTKEKIDTIHADVKAADSSVNVTLPFYNEGKFLVKVLSKNEVISKGEIKISDY
jgi:hypothetical protein